MNCCDYTCNQGRDCPVRQQPYPFTDITPTDAFSDELEDELATSAVQLVVLLLVIFCLAFGLGYITGAST